MAIESSYWRDEMRRDIAWLRKHRTFGRWSEKQMVLYERRLILVAAQIRVLMDQFRVSPELARASVECIIYPKLEGARPTTRRNSASLEKLFDLDSPESGSLGIRDLSNQLLHHYEIFAVGRPKVFSHLLVFSDFKRNACLYEIEIPKLLDFLAQYAHPEAGWYEAIAWVWNDDREDYDVIEAGTGPS
jgi:hypothetical protein